MRKTSATTTLPHNPQAASRRNNYQPYGESHNFARGNQGKFALPKKYALTRPEKRDINSRLGAPDFFPLEPNAPEDLLKQKSIVEGLIEPRIVNDESSSLRKYFSSNGVNVHNIKTQLLQSVHEIEWKRSISPKEKERTKRTATSTFPEQVVTGSQFRESWITRLTGTEPLHRLAMQVPHGFKGDPLLKALIDSNIPALRATWFIKIIYLNMKQNRQKNPIDPTGDWTTTLVRFLIQLLKDFHGKTPASVDNGERYVRPGYILKLVKWSYCEGLLDKDKFLGFMMEQLSETTRTEDVHVTLRVLMQYMEDIAASTIHSRRLLSHINSRLGRTSSKQAPQKSDLEGALKAIGQVLSKEIFTSKPLSPLSHDINSLDLPRIVESLDHSLSIADLEIVYNSIFPESFAISLQDVVARTHLVCEWVITDYRNSDVSACIAVSILKKCAQKLGATFSLQTKFPLQAILTEFLESCAYSSRLWLLYGELLRCGLFSHDGYVRHLISRGRLEGSSISYRTVLEQLPIFDYDIARAKRLISLHERNQRRAILNGLPADSMASQKAVLNAAVELIIGCISNDIGLPSMEPLHQLTLHDKWTISEWLTTSVMHTFSPTSVASLLQHSCTLLSNFLTLPVCTGAITRTIFYVLRVVSDYRSLATLICWLLQNCTEECVLLVSISTARDMIHIFVAQDMVAELLQALGLLSSQSAKAQIAAQNLFLELINAYRKIPEVQKCEVLRKINNIAPPVTTTNQQKANRELERLYLRNRPHLEEHAIVEVAEAVYTMDSGLRMQTIVSAVLVSCAKLPTVELRSQLIVFANLMTHAYARLGPTVLVQDFSATLATLPPITDRRIVAGLLVITSVQQVLPAAVLISNVLVPLLQENVTKLSISGVLAHTEVLIFLICALLGHDCTEVICADERMVFLQSGKLSSLSLVLSPVIQLYSRLQTNNFLSPVDKGPSVQEAISKNIASILQECDFVRICVTEPTYVYKHLQSLGLSMRRQVFNMLSMGVHQGLPLRSHDYISMLTHTNMNELAPKIIVQTLDEVVERHWIVQYSWLQLQLVLDEWVVVDSNAIRNFADLLFGHLTANWTFYTIYNKLVELLGPRTQRHIAKAAMGVLENQFSDDSIASSLVELSYHLKSGRGTFLLEEDGLSSAFVSLILTSLKDITPPNREEYVTSIGHQLNRLVANAGHVDMTVVSQNVMHAVQCGIWLRLKLLAVLHPLTRTQDMASTLIHLLSRSWISSDESEAGLDLAQLLLSTISSLVEDGDDTSRRLTTKMKETYIAIRSFVPPHHRASVEQVLSITPTNPSQLSEGNSWALLEDYPDGPLSPSQLGGSRVDRRVPTYASQALERAETPIKRLRIV